MACPCTEAHKAPGTSSRPEGTTPSRPPLLCASCQGVALCCFVCLVYEIRRGGRKPNLSTRLLAKQCSARGPGKKRRQASCAEDRDRQQEPRCVSLLVVYPLELTCVRSFLHTYHRDWTTRQANGRLATKQHDHNQAPDLPPRSPSGATATTQAHTHSIDPNAIAMATTRR